MKTNLLTCLLIASFSACLPASSLAETIEKKLQEALFAEEGTRDLDKAIEAYKSVIADYDKQRAMAATAVFRIAECYRKKGNKEEAIASYQRLLKEFPGEETLAKLSRENLSTFGVSTDAPAGNNVLASAEAKELVRIKKLVTDSPDLLNDQESALLHVAAARSQLRVAEFLVKSGADVNLPILPSTLRERLGEPEPEVKKTYSWDLTPLTIAAQRGHLAMTKLLLEKGAKPSQFTYTSAVGMGRTAIVDTLLAALPKDGGELLAGAVTGACDGRQPGVLEKLLSHGASVDGIEGELTPLDKAIDWNDDGAVELLLKAGAKPGENSLVKAISKGREKSFDMLAAAGAHSKDALEIAVKYKQRKIAAKLIANLEDINKKSSSGATPLAHAAALLDPDLVRVLLEKGADPNETFDYKAHSLKKTTPLLLALRASYEIVDPVTIEKDLNGTIDLLLKAGAKIDAQESEGRTALGVAARKLRSGKYLPESTIRKILAANPNPDLNRPSRDIDIMREHELVRRYRQLRISSRAERVWHFNFEIKALDGNHPHRLSEVLLKRTGYFDPAAVVVYRAGKFEPEIINYNAIVASGDPSRDPVLQPGAMVEVHMEREIKHSPELLEFLSLAASKKITVIRGEHQWKGLARPGSSPLNSCYEPGAGVVFAETVTALLALISAPTNSSDLTRVEVKHADGKTTLFNAHLAERDPRLDLSLRHGDVITLHKIQPAESRRKTIWISREKDLFLRTLFPDPNAWTQIDLAELIASAYSNDEFVLASPDFSNITLFRNGRRQRIDFHAIADDAIPELELGDVVNIPSLPTPDPNWKHLDEKLIQRLQKLLARKATFAVEGGAAREVKLGPSFYQFSSSKNMMGRTIGKLETPGDKQFDVLSICAPMAVLALGHTPSNRVRVAYRTSRKSSPTSSSTTPRFRLSQRLIDDVLPVPIIEDGDRIEIKLDVIP